MEGGVMGEGRGHAVQHIAQHPEARHPRAERQAVRQLRRAVYQCGDEPDDDEIRNKRAGEMCIRDRCFPSQAKELNAFFDARLNVLLAENADASKEKQYHLQRQILPGIAAYETLQRVMLKEEALQIVHGYVERLARTSHKQLATLLLIPGLYRLVPGVFVKSTRNVFGPAAGFNSKELQVGNGIWRVDMMKCPCLLYTSRCV